jgi:hypothetical protein
VAVAAAAELGGRCSHQSAWTRRAQRPRRHVIVHGAHARRPFGGDTNRSSFCVGFNEPPQIDHSTVDGDIEKRGVRPVLRVQVRKQLFADGGIGQWNI